MADFADANGFDLAWLPAPFIRNLPWPALPPVAAALHPSGWPVLGHSKSGGTPVEDTLTRLKTVAHSGTPLDEAAARHLLQQTGLTSVPACSCGSSGGSPVPGGLAWGTVDGEDGGHG